MHTSMFHMVVGSPFPFFFFLLDEATATQISPTTSTDHMVKNSEPHASGRGHYFLLLAEQFSPRSPPSTHAISHASVHRSGIHGVPKRFGCRPTSVNQVPPSLLLSCPWLVRPERRARIILGLPFMP